MLIKNKKTGVESNVTEKEWEKLKSDPLWTGVFVPVISEPKEVQKLKESKATVDKPTTTTTKEVEK